MEAGGEAQRARVDDAWCGFAMGQARGARLDAATHAVAVRLPKGLGQHAPRRAAVDSGRLGQLGALDHEAVEHVERRRVLVALAFALEVIFDELRCLVDGGTADEVVLLELRNI